MAKSLSTVNANEADNTWIKEGFLVEFGFSTTIRYSSRQAVTWNGNAYTLMDMMLSLKTDGSGGALVIKDNDYALTDIAAAQGTAGKSAIVRLLYGEDTTPAAGDADIFFEGEIGPAACRHDVWTMKLIESEAKFMPDILINEANGFNHIPPDGTEISTPNGIIVLKRI